MKKIKLLVLIVICIFIGSLNVYAEEYADCYYNYTPSDSNFKISKGLYKAGATIVIHIAYHETKYPSPVFASRLIFTSDANFGDGYETEFGSSITSKALNCLNTSDICFLNTPSVNINQLRDNSNKLMCPSIYLFKETFQSSDPHYQLALSPDARNSFGESYDSYQKIDYDKNYSKISNNASGSSSQATSCEYNFAGYYSTGQWFTSSGTLGFSIMTDGTVSGIYATGNLANDKFEYKGGTISNKTCPQYIKLNRVMNLTEGHIEITAGTGDSHDAVYSGKVSSGEDNQDPASTVTTYNEYPSGASVSIDKTGGNYSATLKDTRITSSSVLTPISITNLTNSDIQSKCASGNYPKYLVKNKGSETYTLSDEKPTEYDKLFINVKASFGIEGLGKEETYKTCEELLGNELLKWLDENVFMIIRIGVPIILILLTSFDFAKVVFNDDKEGMQNAFRRFGKRAIAAVLIFLTPTIILLISNLVGAKEINSCVETINGWTESDS